MRDGQQSRRESPWPFSPKVTATCANPQLAGGLAPGEFYEGGIDLSFLDLSGECFASFLAETRTSQSVDSILKDFVGGTFEKCTSSVTTTPTTNLETHAKATSITLGTDIYDYAVVQGTGTALFPNGNMTFHLCSPSQLDDAGTLPNGDPDDPKHL